MMKVLRIVPLPKICVVCLCVRMRKNDSLGQRRFCEFFFRFFDFCACFSGFPQIIFSFIETFLFSFVFVYFGPLGE